MDWRPVVLLLLLAAAAVSIALGARSDPLFTLVVWGAAGVVWAGRGVALGRLTLTGAAAMVASVGIVGAGLALAAYGLGLCPDGLAGVTADGVRFDYCLFRGQAAVDAGSGLVIALAGVAAARSVGRDGRWIGFWKSFVPLVALISLVDPGYAGIFVEPATLLVMILLARKSGSRSYRIGLYVICALVVIRLVGFVIFSLQGGTAVVPTPPPS